MFHYIRGRITKTVLPGVVVIENGGIGYEVVVADNSPALGSGKGEEILLYVVMSVRDDGVSLYGFMSSLELQTFNMLRTVSGVGAKAAMSLLSAFRVEALRQAIALGDAATLTIANGIGKKTAQRIVLDLKDKMSAADAIGVPGSGGDAAGRQEREEAMQALVALGYSRAEALESLAGITESGLSAEEFIKHALKNMGR